MVTRFPRRLPALLPPFPFPPRRPSSPKPFGKGGSLSSKDGLPHLTPLPLHALFTVLPFLTFLTFLTPSPARPEIPPADLLLEDLNGPYRTTQAKPNLNRRDPLARRVEAVMMRQARHLISTLHPWEKDPNALSLTASNSGEHDIRPNATTTLGLAILARCAPNEAFPPGLTRAECREKAHKIFRFILSTHGAGGRTCNNDKQWRDQWQSAHWAASAGTAAWLLWDDLDPQTRWLAARMVCDEADRFVGKMPPAQIIDDTKAEENAWNSEVVSLAFCMFPNHPNREKWREAAIQWALSSFVRDADLKANPVVDGKPLNERVAGANVYDDYTLENHARVHPDYMNTITLCEYQKLDYDWAGLPAPEAITFNGRGVYASLKKMAFADGGYVYANGQDWRLHRNPDWFNTHVFEAVMYNDAEAARLMRLGLDVAERMAARHPEGGVYAPGEYFFPSTQHSWIDWTGRAYLLLRAHGEGPEPLDDTALWKRLAGNHFFDTGQFAVFRTPASVSTFSWGRQVMGMVMPLQQDLLLNPHERSLIGTVAVKGVERDTPSVKKAKPLPHREAPAVCGVIARAGGKIEQRFAFVSLPGDRTLYLDSLRPTTDTEVLKLELGYLSVLNDANWVHHDAVRALYHENGKHEFPAAGPDVVEPVALTSKWHNLDNVMGMVCLLSSGRQTYLPNHKPERARISQTLCLNLVEPAPDRALARRDATAPLAETAILFFPGRNADATRALADNVACERGGAPGRYNVRLEDGKTIRIDLAALVIESDY